MQKNNFFQRLKLILQLKCPNCGQGKVFIHEANKLVVFPEMNRRCTNCNYKFDREPGYFLGSMFVSYALAVAEGLLTFAILKICFTELEYLTIAILIAVVILLCSVINYKLARVIWINLFP